jgi:ABC-type transport system involved in cytochrome bd biosynthesis fused ATPase/permease subunit
MVTHERDDLEYVDRVIWLKQGRVEDRSEDRLPATV